MNSRFEIKKSKDGQWVFNLVAANNEVIGTSEMYPKLVNCYKGINSVRANAPKIERFERRESFTGEPYFVLKASNGKVILTSEMYSNNSAREIGIQSVMINAPIANNIEKNIKKTEQ